MPLVLKGETDEQTVVSMVRRGNPEALGKLFDTHSREVYRLAYRILGAREDAEDTVQDVFVGLRRALSNYQETNAFLPWLRRVTVRTALLRLRATRRSSAREQKVVFDHDVTPDPALRITLDDALAALNPSLRDVAVLRLAAGYPHEEIAEMLGISVSASKVRLHRAIRELQTVLRGSL